MRTLYILTVLAVLVAVTASAGGDCFEEFKQRTADAACNRFEFLSVHESDVWGTVDTTLGNALLATDGRYLVDIGPDTYLYDLEYLYSYSSENNQVTVERLASPGAVQREVSFVARLDDYYATHVVKPGLEYHLTLLDSNNASIPTSMSVFMRKKTTRLDRLEYLDINEDLNRLIVKEHDILSECVDSAFLPDFPDSVETIKLY